MVKPMKREKIQSPNRTRDQSATYGRASQRTRKCIAVGVLTAMVLAVVAGAILQASPAEAQDPFRILVSNSGHSRRNS